MGKIGEKSAQKRKYIVFNLLLDWQRSRRLIIYYVDRVVGKPGSLEQYKLLQPFWMKLGNNQLKCKCMPVKISLVPVCPRIHLHDHNDVYI